MYLSALQACNENYYTADLCMSLHPLNMNLTCQESGCSAPPPKLSKLSSTEDSYPSAILLLVT